MAFDVNIHELVEEMKVVVPDARRAPRGFLLEAGRNVHVMKVTPDAPLHKAIMVAKDHVTTRTTHFSGAELVCAPFTSFAREGVSVPGSNSPLREWAEDGFFGFIRGEWLVLVHKVDLLPVVPVPASVVTADGRTLTDIEFAGDGRFVALCGDDRVTCDIGIFKDEVISKLLRDATGEALKAELSLIEWE